LTRTALALAVVLTFLGAACDRAEEPVWQEVGTTWRVLAVDGANLTLEVDVGSSTCDRNPRIVEVVEHARGVTIRAVRETLVNADACTTDMGFATLAVELAEPLGDRFLEGCWPDGRDLHCPVP
jgi:hypothetical protein